MNLSGYTIPDDTYAGTELCHDWCMLQVAHAESLNLLKGTSLLVIAVLLMYLDESITRHHPRLGKALRPLPLFLVIGYLAMIGFGW